MDFMKKIPVKWTPELIARGKERFNIYCVACHGPAGYGNGITTQYGMAGVGNFHQDKFRVMPDGEIFNTITNGKATMQSYASQVKRVDRWAIVAWVRVLQRSQNAKLRDVPEAERAELERKE
jgi:mono/diheme cytochrome c family protein